ncbi:MAG: AmmeMemoRadiSam system radical SAM enzyme [Halobacteriota archaeon]
MIKDAMLWEPIADEGVHCFACSHECKIKKWDRGICHVRQNLDGKLATLIYAEVSSMNVDPIEKKPLFHFYPGSKVFSLGSVSCNFKCEHCQNYDISFAEVGELGTTEVLPERSVQLALERNCRGIAWTYNEPTIWFEYTYDSAILAKEAGLYTVYVTNGYMTPQALEKIGPYLDAANVDVKGFSKKFYNGVCKARLDPVLKTCERMHESGIHLELTYLIIPGLNDDDEQLGAFSAWAAGVDRDIPVHFSRFHPDWRMLDRPATPMETLKKAHHVATQAGLRYIYLGNVASEYEKTFCPDCAAVIIDRTGYRISKRGKTCPRCGYVAPIVD